MIKGYGYGIDTLSIHRDKTETERQTQTERETETKDQTKTKTETFRPHHLEARSLGARGQGCLALEGEQAASSPPNRKPRYPKRPTNRDFTKGYHVFTDGGCSENPGGVGGWAFSVMLDGMEVHSSSGGERGTTNNRMELRAVIAALQWIGKNGPFQEIELHSDSTYCVQGCNDWRHRWKKNQWLKGGSPMPNADLWIEVDRLLSSIPLRLHWVRGHSGVSGNVRADQLASEAIAAVSAQRAQE